MTIAQAREGARFPVRVRLIGEMRVERAGVSAELPPSRKTRGLLAYLLWANRAHRRAQLASILWSDVVDPLGGLRWSLSRLRRLLDDEGRPRVRADRVEISVDRDGLVVDSLVLRAAAGAARETRTEALAELIDTVAEGEFLEGIELAECPDFHAWCVAAREEVRQAKATVLGELVRRLGGEEPERAASYARCWIRLDREDDRAHAALFRALGATGRRREVEEHFENHRAWLAERGLTPSLLLRQAWATARGSGTLRRSAPEPDVIAGPDLAVQRTVPPAQEIRFCRSFDGARIAYATLGEGPPIVKTTNWLSHLEHEWRSSIWSHWLHELASARTLIRYDQRGNGLSDRDVGDFSFEAFVRDLETVVDAVGLERFPLLGISQGCAVAAAYAARHPERVTRLVLVAGFVRGWRLRNNPRMDASMEALLVIMRHGWGMAQEAFRQTFTSLFFPDADTDTMREFNELQRKTATPESAARLMSAFGDFDAVEFLPRVKAPTIVFHSRRDGLIPVSWGREMASGIPGARFVPLESRNHLLLADEPAWAAFTGELSAFLGPEARIPVPQPSANT